MTHIDPAAAAPSPDSPPAALQLSAEAQDLLDMTPEDHLRSAAVLAAKQVPSGTGLLHTARIQTHLLFAIAKRR